MTDRASMRVAYGKALAAYGGVNERVVVLDADVSASTQTHLFAKAFPSRFFNVGIAEAGMVDVAVGLALGGKIPFVNTFAFLLALRAAEQVRSSVAYSRTNVKLVGSYAGLSDAFDGPTHHSLCDLAVMRAIPNMTVVVATDAVEVANLVPAVAEYDGPVYLRVSRADVPTVYGEDHQVTIGKGAVLRAGADVTLVATGVMVHRALAAAERLEGEHIRARVLAIHTVKPLDSELILTAARETGAVVTVEEHSVVGGLGGAVAELVSGELLTPVVRVGLQDTFARTGPYEDLLDMFGMSISDIVSAGKHALMMKN